jgi:hypothetical protein
VVDPGPKGCIETLLYPFLHPISSSEEDIKPRKDKKKKKVNDNEQAKIGEEKVMEKENYCWQRLD